MDERRKQVIKSLTFRDADRSILLAFTDGDDEHREGWLLDAAEWARDEQLTVMQVTTHMVHWERMAEAGHGVWE